MVVRPRSGLMAICLGLPLTVAALAGCGDDGAGSAGAEEPVLDEAARRGQELARTRGCSACHGADGEGGLGPAWTGLLGTEVTLADGSTVVADEAYLRRAIVEPDAEIVEGYSVTMPKTSLTDEEVADLVAYLVALNP